MIRPQKEKESNTKKKKKGNLSHRDSPIVKGELELFGFCCSLTLPGYVTAKPTSDYRAGDDE